jgi:hypothetical protein
MKNSISTDSYMTIGLEEDIRNDYSIDLLSNLNEFSNPEIMEICIGK